jgi:cytochrome P450
MGVQDIANLLFRGRSSASVITAALLSSSVVVLAVAFRFIRSLSSSQKFIAENNCKPAPAWPQKDPFFALDFILEGFRNFRQKTYLDAWRQYYADLGPTFTIRMRGVLYVNTIDPENIKTVLAARFHDYSLSERVEVMGPLLGRGIFVTDGDEWAHSRALLRPNFAKDHVADLGMIDRHFGDLMALLRPHAAAGSAVDLQPLLMRLTLDTATEFLFNKSTRTLSLEHAGPAEHAFGDAFQLSLNEMALLLRLGPFRWLRGQSREITAAHKLCRAYVDRFVDEAWALKQGEKTDDRTYFLKELVESTSDKEKVRDELLNILIAGRDTVASLLGSLFRVLSQRPDIWAKVRAEVAQFEGKLPRYEQLRNLKYAKYCINEGESRRHHYLLHCLVNLPLHESMGTVD